MLLSLLPEFTHVRKTGLGVANALRWALFEKEKLEATLKGFVKWNQKLKELVPHLLDSGRYLANEERVSRLLEDNDGTHLFSPHIRLRRIAQDPRGELSSEGKERLNPSSSLFKVLM